ncbi:hypothetical protein FNF29_00085 [Cafeteria roenbergensis]|uniref:Uncharacterized protein n=1 Tax=Cafeteria roenbergensis TaxID=33653 RepID=A0A5A8CXU0_CAFRO|nr:hypothetical protein FNF29_00085 [Cafeteria roenbergensis]|eukprot:KAA0157509.1 hypothetical protein FNF29_00085 [Cafeteria roenbergensis]
MAAAADVPALRWGVMGCANIAKKNVKAIKAAAGNTLVAVASRSQERAAAWAAEQGLDTESGAVTAHGSYDELLADERVQAVYMPLPTTMHLEWVRKAAAAGKHVLVEKPVAVCAADLRLMAEACAAAGVVLMDGVMFMHHERLPRMGALLGAGELGAAERVVSGFSFPADKAFLEGDIRVKADCDPLGCVGDLGWYNVRFSLWAFGYEMPERVSAVTSRWTDGGRVPTETSATLVFSGGRHSTFACGFHTAFSQWAEVGTSGGLLRLEDFVVAAGPDSVRYTVRRPGGLIDDARRVAPVTETETEVLGCNQEASMFETFAACVRAGAASEAAAFWPEISLKTQLVVDAIMQSSKEGGKLVDVAPVSL